MSEIRTVTTLQAKRDEILFSIRLYEDRIKQARADLAHVNAAIKIFEGSGEFETMGRYVDVYRLYKRGEQITLCKEALASGSKSTRELALTARLSAHSFIENARPAGAHCSGWQEENGADLAVASSGLQRPTGPLPFSHSGL